MKVKQGKQLVRVNERGQRIGESHPNARLSDADVERLIADRGPDGAPLLSLSQLALKYGLSKSGVKGILDGRRRGQVGPTVDRPARKLYKVPTVRVKLSVPLHIRAKLHRLGGAMWVIQMVATA